MTPTHLRVRNVAMVLIGVAGLLLKSRLPDSTCPLAHAYLGNVSASFAVFFIISNATAPRLQRIWIAAIALAIVEAFELTNGFGVMSNTYDPTDYLANTVGVALTGCVDWISLRAMRSTASKT